MGNDPRTTCTVESLIPKGCPIPAELYGDAIVCRRCQTCRLYCFREAAEAMVSLLEKSYGPTKEEAEMNARVSREIRQHAREVVYLAMCEEAEAAGRDMPQRGTEDPETVEITYRKMKKTRRKNPDHGRTEED